MSEEQKDVEGLLRVAIERFQACDAEAAKSACDQVIAQDPDQPVALNLLANLARNAKKWGKAEEIARLGLEKNPKSAQLTNTLGLVLLDRRRLQDAENQFQHALVLKPDRPDYLSNLGLALQHQGKWEEARDSFSKALEQDASFLPALTGRASVATDLGQFETARADLSVASDLTPQTPDILNGLAKLALCQGNLDSAYEAYNAVVAMAENVADARVNRGLIRLIQGRISEGWDDYRMRRRRRWGRPAERYSQIPAWQGDSLTGKTLLVWCEQGLGEAILSLSQINSVAHDAEQVVLECDARLVELAQRSLPGITVVPEREDVHPEILKAKPTLQVSIFDMIGYCNTDSINPGSPSTYLQAEPSNVSALREQYSKVGGAGPLVGISWGSPQAATAREKSLQPELWKPILAVPGLTFVNLQYGASRTDMTPLAARCDAMLVDDPNMDSSGPLSSQADQIAALDLVITVSNTTAHLAGALGQETWVLVPPMGPGSMWYWFNEREDSPWYASAKIFRRQVHSDESFMADVSTKLRDWIVQRSQ